VRERAAGTEVVPQLAPAQQKETATDRGWKVVLFNDDVTPFHVVVFGLQRAAQLSLEVAEMVAYEAHTSGEAVVKRGLQQEEAQSLCERLRAWTSVPGICTGVGCDAIEDDA
jgi:ATP-dependent Clp protease adapter protein ClpS